MSGFFSKSDMNSEATSVAAKRAKKHLDHVAKTLSAALEEFGIEVKVPHGGPSSRTVTLFGRDDQQQIEGLLYENQIATFAEIFASFVTKEGRNKYVFKPTHICLTSLTQVGKTTLLNLLVAMGPCVQLLTGTWCLITRLLINDCSLEDQTKEEAKNFIEFYGELIFSANGRSTTINAFMETFRSEAQEDHGVELDLDIQPFGVCMRTSASKKIQDTFRVLMNVCARKNLQAIVAVDESHARSDNTGVMQRMLHEGFAEFSPAKPGEKQLHWLSRGVSFLGVSATNFSLAKSLIDMGYKPVFLAPGKNYTGYPWEPVEGIRIEVAETPKVMSFADFDAEAGTSLSDFRADWAVDREKYERQNHGGWALYREDFVGELVKAITWMFNNNPAGSRGIIIRLCQKNYPTGEILAMLAALLPDVTIKPYNMDADDAGKKALKTFIKQNCHRDKNYVIFVTCRGRMGTAAPWDLRYGLDFTANTGNLQVLLQGIAGRLTGYNKGQPWVVLSQDNADALNRFIETGEITKNGKEVSPYKPHIGMDSDGTRRHEIFESDSLSPDLLAHFQKVVNDNCKLVPDKKAQDGFRVIRTHDGYVLKWRPLEDFLSDPKFIHPSEEDKKCAEGTMKSEGGKVMIAIRLRSGSYTYRTDKNAKKKEEQGESIDRRVIITVDEYLKVIRVWFPIKREKRKTRMARQVLKTKSAYKH